MNEKGIIYSLSMPRAFTATTAQNSFADPKLTIQRYKTPGIYIVFLNELHTAKGAVIHPGGYLNHFLTHDTLIMVAHNIRCFA